MWSTGPDAYRGDMQPVETLDLGPLAASVRPRLHAPVGLALGGRAPESIALAIVAEIHAFVHLGGAAGAPRVEKAS